MEREYDREPIVDFPPASLKRVSWSAVFAGVVVALVVQLALTLLGLGIGAATINPLTEDDPTRGLTTGSAIWLAISTIIALFAGGYVSGRLAGVPRREDSLMHGLVMWGATTLVTFWMLGTTVGSLISSAASMVGKGVEVASQTAAAGGPALQTAAQRQQGDQAASQEKAGQGSAIGTIRERAREMLRETSHPEARPESLHRQAKDTVQRASNKETAAAQDPRYSDDALEAVLDRIDESGTSGVHPSDRDDLAGILVARTGMSREQAESRIAEWERSNQGVMKDYEQEQARVEQQVREAGATAASAVARASIATFFLLLLGAVAGAFGGMTGAPRDIAYGIARS